MEENENIKTRNELKNWFKSGLKPTQSQFWTVWDSFWHKKDAIPVNSIEGMQEILDEKANAEALQNHLTDENAHADKLTETKIDWYVGERLVPKNKAINGFLIQKSVNGSVGFSAINPDQTSNGAIATIGVGASTDPYKNGTSISHFGANYYVPHLRSSGALYSDKSLTIMVAGAENTIDFRTGPEFANTTSKFKISYDGKVTIGVEPEVDNSQTKLLARASDGVLVEVDKESLGMGDFEKKMSYDSYVAEIDFGKDKLDLIELHNTFSSSKDIVAAYCTQIEKGTYVLSFDREVLNVRTTTVIINNNLRYNVAKVMDSEKVKIETYNFHGELEDTTQTAFIEIKVYPTLEK